MPRSLRPVMTILRSAWSLISARKARSLTAPACLAPFPSSPWQAAQARAKTFAPRSLSPTFFGARYGGGSCFGGAPPQRALIPFATASTCAAFSGPPLSREKAGIGLFCAGVTGRPSVITRSNSSLGTMARNIGSLSGGAGPSLPSAPWQPAQCVAYRTPKSVTWSAGTGRSAGLGRPGRSQPARRKDKERRDKETRRQGDIGAGAMGNASARVSSRVGPVLLTALLLVSLSPCLLVSPRGRPRSRPPGPDHVLRAGCGSSPSG